MLKKKLYSASITIKLSSLNRIFMILECIDEPDYQTVVFKLICSHLNDTQ